MSYQLCLDHESYLITGILMCNLPKKLFLMCYFKQTIKSFESWFRGEARHIGCVSPPRHCSSLDTALHSCPVLPEWRLDFWCILGSLDPDCMIREAGLEVVKVQECVVPVQCADLIDHSITPCRLLNTCSSQMSTDEYVSSVSKQTDLWAQSVYELN